MSDYLEKQADDLLEIQPSDDEIKKLAEELEKMIEDSKKQEIDLDLGDLLQLSAKTVFNTEKTESKKRVKRSFIPIADWKLHHKYIYEVFNPPEERKEKKSLKERLPELPWWYELLTVRSTAASQVYDWVSPSYKIVWRSEQAPKLGDIKIEKVSKQPVSTNPITASTVVLNLNQAILKVITKMASYVSRENRKLQSDQIITLYEQQAYNPQRSDRFFLYFYTDYERRSPFHYSPIKQNAESKGTVALYYVGQTIGGLVSSAIKFGTTLITAMRLEVPQKCRKQV